MALRAGRCPGRQTSPSLMRTRAGAQQYAYRASRGSTIDELVAGYTYQGGKLTPVMFQHDQVMSVVAATQPNGGTQEAFGYWAFGETQATTGTPISRLKYTGREDDGTGLYQYRARYYDPSIGRFISEDPKGFAAGANFYAYVHNNPLNASDPSGMLDLGFAAGFHLPVSPGVAVGPVFSSQVTGYSNNPSAPLTSNPTTVDIAVGVIADIGVQAKISDISGTGGANASPYSINFGLGTFGGIQITPRISQDQSKSIFNPTRYIDGISFGIGIGVATPINGSRETGGSTSPAQSSRSFGSGASFDPGLYGTPGSAAAGGFLIYPNKPNTNQMQSVYSK